MSDLDGLLEAVVREPQAEDRWSVLGDWLEENDDPRRAELLRLHRRLLATCCDPDRHPERAMWQARVVELLGQGVHPCVPQRTVALAEGVEMAFSFVPPGDFLMSSLEDDPERPDDETRHRVELTMGYWLGNHPVTQAQWRAVMGDNPSRFKEDALPVELVSWGRCQKFVGKLEQKTGERFRLPTEAEWEHAARAGTTTPFFFGETISTDQANYNGNYTHGRQGKKGAYRQKTTPAGNFPANAWGLHDMHGNIWEWCLDSIGDESDAAHVLRGGSWNGNPSVCRSASRWIEAHDRLDDYGCRVLLCRD